MSSITFRDEVEACRVGGRERAYCGLLTSRIYEGFLDLHGSLRYATREEKQRLAQALNCDNVASIEYRLLPVVTSKLVFAGDEWDLFTTQLNTAAVFGGDAMRFVARVHGQCEIHGYVEGPDRTWLAEIIDEGLDLGILRQETQGYGRGWEDVAQLLRRRSDLPVVMSYSVCDSFPPRDPEKDEQMSWEAGIAALRARPGLRMDPEDWATFRFGDGRHAMDLARAVELVMRGGVGAS